MRHYNLSDFHEPRVVPHEATKNAVIPVVRDSIHFYSPHSSSPDYLEIRVTDPRHGVLTAVPPLRVTAKTWSVIVYLLSV